MPQIKSKAIGTQKGTSIRIPDGVTNVHTITTVGAGTETGAAYFLNGAAHVTVDPDITAVGTATVDMHVEVSRDGVGRWARIADVLGTVFAQESTITDPAAKTFSTVGYDYIRSVIVVAGGAPAVTATIDVS